jgi:hypothetical protein
MLGKERVPSRVVFQPARDRSAATGGLSAPAGWQRIFRYVFSQKTFANLESNDQY